MAQPEVTFALTSANRLDLLETTLESFMKFNRYPITRYLLIDDSGVEGVAQKIKQKWPFLEVLWNQPQIGQTASIDKMYAQIQTEYIFHCEDDWEFTDYDFVEKSMEILTQPGNEKIVQIWIRGVNDTNGHPVLMDTKYVAGTTEYYLLSADYYMGCYGGFGFHPGLRRLCDYKLAAPYTALGGAMTETKVSIKYIELGFKAATLIPSYMRHIGSGRHTDRNGLL